MNANERWKGFPVCAAPRGPQEPAQKGVERPKMAQFKASDLEELRENC